MPEQGGAKDKTFYAKQINRILTGDEHCGSDIPINETDDSLFKCFKDGMIFAKLLYQVDNNSINLNHIDFKSTKPIVLKSNL